MQESEFLGRYRETSLGFAHQEVARREMVDELYEKIDSWANVLPNTPGLEDNIARFGLQKVRTEVLPSGLVLLVSDVFEIYDPPHLHDYSHLNDKTNFSDAKYHAEQYVDQDKVFLYSLPANSHTSRHTHDTPELQKIIYGSALMDGRKMDKYVTTKIGTNHQITTGNEPAIIMVALLGAKNIPEDLQHIHSE